MLANIKKLIHLSRLALSSSNPREKIASHNLKTQPCTQKGFQHQLKHSYFMSEPACVLLLLSTECDFVLTTECLPRACLDEGSSKGSSWNSEILSRKVQPR